MAAEDATDGLGLGLAQLGELVGHVGDRAVLLAELLADRSLTDRSSVATLGERPCKGLGRLDPGLEGWEMTRSLLSGRVLLQD